MSAALLLAAAALTQADPAADRPWTSVEREWSVRAWALEPAAHTQELIAALSAERWTRRAAALDALRRALEVGTLGAGDLLDELELHALPNLLDPDSPAVAQALDAFASWPRPSVEPRDLVPLLAHPAPAVRAALARYAGVHARVHGGVSHFASLLNDEDAGVVRAAIRAWAADPALAAHSPEPAALLAEYQVFERVPASDELLLWLVHRGRDTPYETLYRALRLRHHGHLEGLVSGWTTVAGTRERQVLLRAARSARARGQPLWEGLLERAATAPDGDAAWLLESALEAADPNDVLARVHGDARFDAGALWELLVGREVAWDLARTRPWIDPESDPRVRLRAVRTLAGSTVGGPGDAGDAVGELLAAALEDPNPTVVRVAFRALARAPDTTPWFDSLFAAWRASPAEARLALLDELPRVPPPLPFRAELLALARANQDAARDDARTGALELLAEFPGIADELAPEVRTWLDDELDALAGGAARERRAHELSGLSLVRWLHRVLGVGATSDLERALERAARTSEDVGKSAIRALGETAEGRAGLGRWLAEDAPARLRVEAALQLAPHGDEAALGVLVERYWSCDWELRKRVLDALREREGERTRAFLEQVARADDQEYELRNLALHGLAWRAPGAELFIRVLEDSRDLEVTRTALRALGYVGGERARDHLRGRLQRIEALALEQAAEGELELALHERDSVLAALALAARGGDDPDVTRAWLRLPLAAAAGDLRQRFVGGRLAAVTFRWSGELELAGLLGATPALGPALAASGPWWRLDARLLAELAERAEVPALAARLRRAALVGLFGEGPAGDRPALELRLARALLADAEGRRDWAAFEHLAGRALLGWRTGRYSDRAWSAVWSGDYRPERGVDPAARLESARLQARAWSALERGEADAARGHAAASAAALGFSAEARAAQGRLEAALDSR